MIELKPHVTNQINCPRCKAAGSRVNEILFQPIVMMAECTCEQCGFEFLSTLSTGHTVKDQIAFDKTSGEIFCANENWLTKLLSKNFVSVNREDVVIHKLIRKISDKVIILNTLDFLYGHVLLKLFNALYHLEKHSEFGLILIIPKSFEWLIPDGCAEVWVVDLKLNRLAQRYERIEKFVKTELQRFSTIYLSKAYSHPDMVQFDIGRLTGVNSFGLSKFQMIAPTFTFVLREDRWWLKNIFDYWIYRIGRKMKLTKWSNLLLTMQQDRLVAKTIRKIKSKLPNAKFHIAGLGKRGGLSNLASDHRTMNVNDSTEINWCKVYASSHVVIGVHGSNMLLPTAMAAGSLEILPEDRYGNMVQDIVVRYGNRLQLFFYRFVDQYAAPKAVAEKAVSMILDYEMYYANMCLQQYTSLSDKKKLTSVSNVDDARH